MSPKIVIIGSTGKLGSKLLDYTYKNNIKITAITCFKNKKKILFQKKKFGVSKKFILSELKDYTDFINFLKNRIDIIYFLDFGSFSLTYVNQFIKFNTKSIIAIANKEMIIAGGKILINSINKSKNKLVSLDSEHYSLKNSINKKAKLISTAIGGLSNPSISRRVISQVHKSLKEYSSNEIFVQVMWTGTTRKEFFFFSFFGV